MLFGLLCICMISVVVFFFKQKTAYEMRISDWSSDVCSSDLGRMQFGIELRIIDGDGTPLPWDGEQAGALQVRGPWVVDRYLPAIEGSGSDGWFDTGDIGTIDRFGFLRLTDRSQAVIQSGGENTEERRGGKGGVSKCSTRGGPAH